MASPEPGGGSRIVWAFPLGHGHAAQFENLRDGCPEAIEARSIWVGMNLSESGDWLANRPWVPASVRTRRHAMWHLSQSLGSQMQPGDVLFNAAPNLRFVLYHRRYRSYFYTDCSPSLMQSLSPWYDHVLKRGRIARLAKRVLSSLVPRSARAVFAMSRWCADGVVRDYGIDPRRVHVVPPGANLRLWRFVDRQDRPPSPVRILMVGGEFRRKGGDRLIAWAERTPARGCEVDIVTWPEQLPDRIRQVLGHPRPGQRVSGVLGPWLPHVRVHCGVQPNSPTLLSLYAQADVFCLPTRADFSSIATIEAMATGLPVIAGRVGGIPELVEEGRTGFLVAPDDDATLAERLHTLIEDRSLRLRIGRAGRTMVEAQLNVERQIVDLVRCMDLDGQPAHGV